MRNDHRKSIGNRSSKQSRAPSRGQRATAQAGDRDRGQRSRIARRGRYEAQPPSGRSDTSLARCERWRKPRAWGLSHPPLAILVASKPSSNGAVAQRTMRRGLAAVVLRPSLPQRPRQSFRPDRGRRRISRWSQLEPVTAGFAPARALRLFGSLDRRPIE